MVVLPFMDVDDGWVHAHAGSSAIASPVMVRVSRDVSVIDSKLGRMTFSNQ
jgi:hypothetical protein